jgi:GR25 family glycosyltransferase involved in LPS biosynthesis
MIFLFISFVVVLFLFFLLHGFVLHQRKSEHFTNEMASPISLVDKMDICMINLDKDKDRWNRYQNSSLPIQRFPGFYGKDLNRKELIEEKIIHPQNRLGDGQLGCALSHLTLWEESISYSDKPYVLILEDDVTLSPDIIDKINALESYFPENWDILFLGGCNVHGKKYNERFLIPTENNRLYNLCLHAVMFRKKSIPKILEKMKPLDIPIDNKLREHYDDFNVYFTYPNLINQNKELISIRREIDGMEQSEFWKKNHMNITLEDEKN